MSVFTRGYTCGGASRGATLVTPFGTGIGCEGLRSWLIPSLYVYFFSERKRLIICYRHENGNERLKIK